jgi:UDP-glucose 4-epimerase
MKKILITGANSYIGTSVEKWLMKEPNKYYIETLDMRDPKWKEFDFSKFEVVFHVAGIAHVSTKKNMKDTYFKVNRDLAIETAIKAKDSGVKQFIFMSSMIVYNSKETVITKMTIPNPDNFYGQSKFEAEKSLKSLETNDFKIAILRPPMIYGPNSKGNYSKLRKLAIRIKVFPNYDNKRSMLYIENLLLFIEYLVVNNKNGTFMPQNSNYTSTPKLVKSIAEINQKKLVLVKLFNPIISLLSKKILIFNKLFSDYYYDFKDDVLKEFISLEDSIKSIELNEAKNV